MSEYGATARASCYAIISSMESDMRRYLVDAFVASGLTEFLHPDLRTTAQSRLQKDTDADTDRQASDYGLIEYLDFADLSRLIFTHAEVLPSSLRTPLSKVAHTLNALVPIRNRVCHSRPLEPDDFSQLFDAASEMLDNREVTWPELRETIRILKFKPASLLSVVVPSYWTKDVVSIQHNLPVPDFEDTGFIGRSKDVAQVKRYLRGPYPVISIIGEGGLGKTSLAIKALYDLLDDDEAAKEFDVICWVSLKSHRLTATGISDIKNALVSALDLFQYAAETLGAPKETVQTIDEALAEVLQYMQEFRVLLALDNIETIGFPHLVDFFRKLPSRSKVLMTSRIGMGQIELAYPLVPLELKDAAQLMRRAAISINLKEVVQGKKERVEKWCKQLYFNPLAIKWFVSAVSLGKNPEVITNSRSADYKVFLKFSFENLYAGLTDDAQRIVLTLSVVGRPISRTELSLVLQTINSSLTQDQIDVALALLYTCSVVRRQISTHEPTNSSVERYYLTEFASQFARHLQTIPREFTTRVQRALTKLRDVSETAQRDIRYYKYSGRAVRARTKEEQLVGTILMQAIKESEKALYEEALVTLERAERLMSQYSEIHRLRAFVLSRMGDVFKAQEEHEIALECDPSSTIAQYDYARFLLHDAEDYETAFRVATQLVASAPEDAPPRALLALIECRRGNYARSAELFEELLSQDHAGRTTKHRTSMRDQAAETYRRWCEQHLSYKEATEFRRCIGRAVEIVIEGFLAGEKDWRLEQRLEEICGEAVIGSCILRDDLCASELVKTLAAHREVLPKAINVRASLDRFTQTFAHLPGLVETLKALPIKSVSASDSDKQARPGERRIGSVIRLAAIGDYGFIGDSMGESWFFHRHGMIDPDSWAHVVPGWQCSFRIGSNTQGPCAVDVAAREA